MVEELYVNQTKTEYLKSKVDISADIENFLTNQYSPHTQKGYRQQLNRFIKYCRANNINPIEFKYTDTPAFIAECQHTLASRTTRLIITTCGSFFKYLSFVHREIDIPNPFYMTKLPRIIDQRQTDYPLDHDIEVLKQRFKQLGRHDILLMIELIVAYGWRIGMFKHMTINPATLKYASISKGTQKEGKVTRKQYDQIQATNLLNIPESTLRQTFIRYAKQLYNQGKISCSPSPHDLRRYHIDRQFDQPVNSAKDVLDIAYRYHDNPMTTFSHYVNRNVKRTA